MASGPRINVYRIEGSLKYSFYPAVILVNAESDKEALDIIDKYLMDDWLKNGYMIRDTPSHISRDESLQIKYLGLAVDEENYYLKKGIVHFHDEG